jgi:hypothetical protein
VKKNPWLTFGDFLNVGIPSAPGDSMSQVLGASYAPSCPQAEQQAEQQKDENG